MSELVRTVFRFSGTLAPGAHQVAVVGPFNSWDPVAHRLTRTPDGDWRITVYLSPGRVVYRFDVDGAHWLDPFEHGRLSNGWGSEYSVRYIRRPRKTTPRKPDPASGPRAT
jgi:1,4-alpha-glucan branching enzyme